MTGSGCSPNTGSSICRKRSRFERPHNPLRRRQQESPVPEIGMLGLTRRELETCPREP